MKTGKKVAAPLGRAERELEEFDKVFKALAHPTRRHVLVKLLAVLPEMSAGEIVKHFSDKWPTITRHLKVLEDAGLVVMKKEGTQHIYSIQRERMKMVLNNWLQWF